MENKKIRVAITQGDTNGVGMELILKVFSEPEFLELCTPIIYCSPKVATSHLKALDIQMSFNTIAKAQEARDGKVNLLDCFDNDIKVEFGQHTAESSLAGAKALEKALSDYTEGLFDVLVCAPMENDFANANGQKFANQAKYIEMVLGNKQKATAIHINEMARMTTVTETNDFGEVVLAITAENISNSIMTLHSSIKRDFRISNPRIAVLALNAPDNGNEENEVLMPVIRECAEKSIQVFGPYQAESFFEERKHEEFDGILAIYPEQVTKAMNLLEDVPCVQLLTGLPLVCTIPEGGTQMDIAGKNMAEPAALRNAIYVAIDTFRFRKEYDAPLRNPLPKLYHERPDSGEKLRFSIPKKKEG